MIYCLTGIKLYYAVLEQVVFLHVPAGNERWQLEIPYKLSSTVERSQAKVSKGEGYKEKGEPIGTTPYRPVVTVVHCVSSWNSFCLTFLFSRHPFLMLPLSLDLVCPWHLWILTAIPVDSSPDKLLVLHSSFSYSILFYSCHSCLNRERSFFTYFYTEKLFRTELLPEKFYTQRSEAFTQKFLHTEAFTHSTFYTEKLLHKEAFTHSKISHSKLSHNKLLHTASFYTASFYAERLLHSKLKTESRHHSNKKDGFETLFTRNFQGKITSKYCIIIITSLMQPLQLDLRRSAAKDTS